MSPLLRTILAMGAMGAMPRLPEPRQPKVVTQADLDRIEAARLKRERKAAAKVRATPKPF